MRSFQEFGRLADVVGGEAALRLAGFAGAVSGRPNTPRTDDQQLNDVSKI